MTTDNDSLETLSDADRQLIAIGKELAKDPKTRKEYLKLIKAKYPGEVIPELDTEAAIIAATKPYVDRLAKLEKEHVDRDVAARIKERRDGLKSQGYTDDDVKAIEEMMVKEQIPSHATAANYYKLSRQAAQPTPSTMHTTTLPVDKKSIKEAGGIKNWARAEAGKAIDEIKSGRVKLH